MKLRILSAAAALFSCAAVLAGVFPVSAAYAGAQEIALNVRPMTDTEEIVSVDDSLMRVGAKAAREGALLHFGIFIEAEYADLAFMSMKLASDSPDLCFTDEGYQNPTLRNRGQPRLDYKRRTMDSIRQQSDNSNRHPTT